MSVEDPPRRDRRVSLAMYVDPPVVRMATRRLWAHIRDSLHADGLDRVPHQPDETIAYDAAWTDGDLLLAQTCGYPFASRLRGTVRLVATPCYDHPGCIGAFGGSFVVVRADEGLASIADLAGRRAAINDRVSNSGYNLLRAIVAPHARDGAFFSSVVQTGGHAASLAAIADGTVDVASVDCVTWGNHARYAPDLLRGLRILAETPKTPGLPLITHAATTDVEVELLRAALNRAVADPLMAETCATLGLRGFETLADQDYDVVLRLERDATALNYPAIA